MLTTSEMTYPAPTESFLRPRQDTAMVFALFGYTYMYPPHLSCLHRTCLPRSLLDMTSWNWKPHYT